VAKKKSPSKAEGPSRSWWDEFDLFHDGYGSAWGIILVPGGETPKGTRRLKVKNVAIKEDKLAKVLASEFISDDLSQWQRELVATILQRRQEDDAGISKIRGRRFERRRPMRVARDRQKGARRFKARKGLSRRKAHYEGQGLSRRRSPRLAETAV